MKRSLMPVVLSALCSMVNAADWSSRPLSELAVHPEFRALASVEPRDEAQLSAEVAGRVTALPARIGERIGKGAMVARIDDRQYRIEVRQAQAQLSVMDNRIRLAEAQLAQSESLAARQFISADALRIRRTDVAVLRSEREAAAAGLAAARLALEKTVVRAPFDGVVRSRTASVGDLAAAGTPLVVFAATGEVEVRARVPREQLAGLRGAGKWRLVAGDTVVALAVKRVSPLVNQTEQTREVIFSAAVALSPGVAGEVRWDSPQTYLPPGFVQQRDGRFGSFVDEGGKAVFRALPDAQPGRPVAVDWPAETRVIDSGRFALELPGAAK
ncbi:MAG: efflux RND transporter periplasmic adaptor subunit [Rhodocyclaceae bacterium]